LFNDAKVVIKNDIYKYILLFNTILTLEPVNMNWMWGPWRRTVIPLQR